MKKIWLLTVLTTLGIYARAQWECPSKLAANLDPVGNSNLLVGGELGLTTGVLDGNLINSAFGFVGADYTLNKHSLYFEGGIKSWGKYNFDDDILFKQARLGLRELFYQYHGKINNITVGLQSATFDDHFLLNERIAGLNYKADAGRWKLNIYSGTVTKDFARNGIYCTTGFLYELPTGQNAVNLGNTLGDKNLAGFTFTWFPQKEMKKKEKAAPEKDEFETFDNAEFESFETDADIQTQKTKSLFELEKAGVAGYSEFGNWISEPFFLSGIFAEIKLPGDFYLKPEVLYQSATNNNALTYLVKIDKNFNLKNGHSATINTGWYGFSAIDAGAALLNSYSNIMAGEVLRLDAVNMPFVLTGVKYTIPSVHLHFKIQYVTQFNENNLNEGDLEIGKKFGKKLFLNSKFGLINGGELTQKTTLARLELRYYL